MSICVLSRAVASKFELDGATLIHERHGHISYRKAESRVASGEWRWVDLHGERRCITDWPQLFQFRDASAVMGVSVIEAYAAGSRHAKSLFFKAT